MLELSIERAISNYYGNCLILSAGLELANQSCMYIVFRILGLHPKVCRTQSFKLLSLLYIQNRMTNSTPK